MKVDGRLWIDIGGSGIAGQGRIALLELVHKLGSIKKASEEMKMSYKAAWDAVNSLNEIYGRPLVERQTGGKGGGGTTLTEAGKNLVKAYNHFSRMHSNYLETMSFSNKLAGVVISIAEDHVIVKTSAGDKIAGTILDNDISVGENVVVFINPRDIILINSDDFKTSARNILKSEVKKIKIKDGNAEITLKTLKGTELIVSITAKSCEKLSLQEEFKIFILFKTASALVMK